MYKSFILPQLHSDDILLDNCTETQSNMLETLHSEAIRSITRGIRGTSHQQLYEESGFSTLIERRKRHRLLLFHKWLGLCPQYLPDLLPPLVSNINPYHRHRPIERVLSTYKTELFRNSFVPSTISECNSFSGDVQQTTSLSVFKRALCTSDSKVQAYYCTGERSAQIIHCRLRLQMSNLNNNNYV